MGPKTMVNPAAEAQELLRQGRIREAESAFARVLETHPDHPDALNALALSALRGGDARRAIELLKRAARTNPVDAVTQHHLGRAYEALGDWAAAAAAQQSAVRQRPEFSIARLYWALALERNGQQDEAVLQYMRALGDGQKSGRWLNPETTPPPLRPLIEHAVMTVRDRRGKAFASLFEPLVARFGRDSLSRIDQALRIYFNQEAAEYPDSRQRPTFFFVPGLPTTPYLDRSLFSWIDDLEAQTAQIKTELLNLLPQEKGRERVFTSIELEQANLRGYGAAPDWTGFYFYRHGARREDNCATCPNTARAIDALPLSRVRNHGPEVLYSVFAPGTHLLPHQGVTNTRLVGHLPLLIPENCALSVGGEVHAWVEGRTVVFDDTYEHEAWNRSTQTRVVMIFDLWNPHLTETERLAVAEIVCAIGDFRESVAQA